VKRIGCCTYLRVIEIKVFAVCCQQSDLSFKSGDHVTVFGDPDEDGFYYAEIDGRRGLVPADYLRDNPGSTSSTGQQQSSPYPSPAAPSGHGGSRSTVAAGTTSTSDRRSRSAGGHAGGHTPSVQQSTNSIDRGTSAVGTQPQTGTGARHHHDSGSSTRGSRRHRSGSEDGQPVGGGRLVPTSSIGSGAMADRSKSSAGGPSGSDAGTVGRDRGSRSYSGVSTAPDGSLSRQIQQR